MFRAFQIKIIIPNFVSKKGCCTETVKLKLKVTDTMLPKMVKNRTTTLHSRDVLNYFFLVTWLRFKGSVYTQLFTVFEESWLCKSCWGKVELVGATQMSDFGSVVWRNLRGKFIFTFPNLFLFQTYFFSKITSFSTLHLVLFQ